MSQRGENESRGRSLIRKSLRPRSRDDDWNANQNNKMAVFHKNKHVCNKITNNFPKSTKAKPKSISSKCRSGSSTCSNRKFTCSKQTEKKFVSKPKFKWMPKLKSNKSSSSSVYAVNENSDVGKSKEKSVNVKSQPRIVMTWVPKSK